MAAQVLSGSGNVSYTNSTGQNVRLVINYLKNITAAGTMTFQGVTVDLPANQVYGKTLAFQDEFVIEKVSPLERAISRGITACSSNVFP